MTYSSAPSHARIFEPRIRFFGAVNKKLLIFICSPASFTLIIYYFSGEKPNHRSTVLPDFDYKLDLPVVKFGVKFHGNGGRCQNRGSGMPRTAKSKACGRRTIAGAWLRSRFWTPWPTVLLPFLLWQNFVLRRRALSHVRTISEKRKIPSSQLLYSGLGV